MADDGLTTGQIPTTELIDDVIGNREGNLRRITAEALAAQVSETGALAAKFDEQKGYVDEAVEEAEGLVGDAQLIKDYIGGAVFPIGAVAIFPVDSVPSTFLAMEGQAVTSDYPDLRQLLIDGGSLWGTDGSGDPLLPDTRGEFIRGWDDGRGVDTERALGTAQSDANKAHHHKLYTASMSSGSVGGFGPGGYAPGVGGGNNLGTGSYQEAGNSGVQLVEDSGESEARPRNIAMIYAIKAFHAYADLTGKLIDPATIEETTQLKLDAQAALAGAEAAQAAAESSEGAAGDAQEAAEAAAGIVSRATSVAGLTDPATLSEGDQGMVSGSGSGAVDGIYEVQSSAWEKVGELSNASKVGYADGARVDAGVLPSILDRNGKPAMSVDALSGFLRAIGLTFGGPQRSVSLRMTEGGRLVVTGGMEIEGAAGLGLGEVSLAEEAQSFLSLRAGNLAYLSFDEYARLRAVLAPSTLAQIAREIDFSGLFEDITQLVAPSADIDILGDSMANSNFQSGMAAYYSAGTVTRRNYGGQTTQQLAIIQGYSKSLTVTVAGNEIPASGGVAITDKSTNILYNGGNYTGTVSVTINGVQGVISTDAAGNWTFTRSSTGSVVSVPADTLALLTPDIGTSFIPAPDSRLGQIQVLRMGRNGRPANRAQVVEYADLICGMIDRLTPRVKQVLVYPIYHQNLGTQAARDSDLALCQAANEEVRRRIGDKFLDGALEWAVQHAIYDIGLTPDATDLAHMADGHLPPQLFSDSTHMTSAMSQAEGALVAKAIKSGKGT